LPFTVAPGPLLLYSESRAFFHENPLMSVQGWPVRMCAPRTESRIRTCGLAVVSPPGCHGRPRYTVPAAPSLVSRELVIRIP
jgi:hypothetical protein